MIPPCDTENFSTRSRVRNSRAAHIFFPGLCLIAALLAAASIAALLAVASIAAPLARADSDITLRDGWAVQSSAKVNASGEVVSTAGFDASSWYKTSAPNTVFAVLVENGVYTDPYFGMNLRSIPGVSYPIGGQFANLEMPEDSPYAVPW